MNRAFADTLRSTGQFSTHFVTLSNDVAKFGKNLDAGRLKLSDYYNVWQGHMKKTSSLVTDLAKQQVQLENAVLQPLGKNAQGLMQYNVNVANGIDIVKNKTALASQEMSIMNKVMQDGANQLINWGKNTQWAGRQLTVGLTVPLAAFGVQAQKAFLDADTELTRLVKVYGGLAPVAQSELNKVKQDVTATAKLLANTYGAAYKETIALAADIAATGAQGNDLIQRTIQTTRLAVLGEVSRQDAMKATLTIQNTFKQNTEQLTQSIDFLNAVENQTSTTLQDLTDAIPKAGPVFKALGGNVKDLSLMLVAMKEGGIDAASGANALKSAMASLVNPTKAAQDMFKKFGIDLSGIVTRDTGNITQMVLDLQKALESLTPLERSQAIEKLFGKFQFSRMSALFQNLGKQGSQTLQVMDLMKASATDLANISARELKQQTESASGRYKRALASIQADLASTGQGFLKISTLVLNTIDKIVQFVNHLPGPIKTVLGFLGGLTAIAGPLIMLTGVLGNFFGYIVKGIFHLKQLAKGGASFKLLTPEIVAAQKAGTLMADSFYSDAKATTVLADAVYTLAKSFDVLKAKALEATTIVNNGVSTIGGNEVIPNQLAVNGERMANKNHPLIGKPYSRDMVHLIPTASQTDAQKMSQTIFSTVPGPKPVNQRIGNNPQIYMQGNLPKIQGITAINGVSTGIVAEEAAKWHAMTAAIATQSETEIAALKQEVAATGTITESLSTSYQKMLPAMTELTTMAAKEAAVIVEELNAGKLTVDAAKAKIVALNANVEAMMAETSASIASNMGRGINLTTVPLTTQSVVSSTGTSNMKELFHKSSTSTLLDKIAGVLGVRTSGGGYSVETTKPLHLNSGGPVYLSEGSKNVVPGVGNTDTVPAMLTPGEFVVNKKATEKNFPLLQSINNGYNLGGRVKSTKNYYGEIPVGQPIKTARQILEELLNGISGLRKSTTRSARVATTKGALDYSQMSSRTGRNRVWANPILSAGQPTVDEIVGHIYDNSYKAKFGTPAPGRSAAQLTAEQLRSTYGIEVSSRSGYTGLYDVLPNNMVVITKNLNTKLNSGTALAKDWLQSGRKPEHFTSLINSMINGGYSPDQALQVARRTLDAVNEKLSRFPADKTINEFAFGNLVTKTVAQQLKEFESLLPQVKAYALGGRVVKTKNNYGIMNSAAFMARNPKLYGKSPAAAIESFVADELGRVWLGEKNTRPLGPHLPQVNLTNNDPLHGPLQIGRYAPPLTVRNRQVPATIRYKGSPTTKVWDAGPQKGQPYTFFARNASTEAFITGSEAERAKYVTEMYMKGAYSVLRQAGAKEAQAAVAEKANGIFFRGINLTGRSGLSGGNMLPLPKDIIELIKVAQRTGQWEALLGKEFLMRRSSWSTNKDTASGFGPIMLEALVKNRKVTPASQMFPDLKFPTAQGSVAVNENESIFGGKFRIVSAKDGHIQLETISGRAIGGPVSGGTSYVVGERGPELFTPQSSGSITPNSAIQHFKNGGPVYNYVGNGGVRGRFYGAPQIPYAPGLNLMGSTTNAMMDSMTPFIAGVKTIGSQITASFTGLATKLANAPLPVIGQLNLVGEHTKDAYYELGAKVQTVSTSATAKIIASGDALKAGIIGMGVKMKAAAMTAGSGIKNFVNPQYYGTVAPGTSGTGAGTTFAANLRYSSANMFHPLRYIQNRTGRTFTGQGMVTQMGASMVGGAIGQKVGGGTGALIGSIAAPMAIQGAAKAFNAIKVARAAGGGLSALGGAGLLEGAAAFAGLAAPLVAVAAAVAIGIKLWRDHQKYVRLNALGFGLTAEAASKAKLSFKDYNSTIKTSMQSISDLKARNDLLYKSLASSGTPLKMTISEYASLKKEVSSVFSEQIKTINQTDSNKLGDLAVRLKEQFINAGMSAEDATKKIYTMFQVSNKAGQAATATFSNKAFTSILDAKTSSVGSIKSYGDATKTQREGSAQAAALNTAMQGIDAAIKQRMDDSALAASKDLTGKTKALTLDQAEKAQLDAINKAKGTGVTLTQKTLDELEKTNPEIKKFASTSDTVVSLWQKLRLQAAGFQGDLSKLNADQVAAVSSLNNTIQDAVTNANKNGLLKAQYANLDKLTAQQKALTKAAAGQTAQQQVDSKAVISQLQKEIDATNKLAAARIKALDAAQADADLATAIAKKKLEIAQDVGSGNTGAAQQAQLDLANLNSQQQHNAQVTAIQNAADAANAPKQAHIDALNAQQSALADSSALASDQLTKVSDAAQTQKDKIDAVNTAMQQFELALTTSGKTLADYLKTDAGKGQAAVIAAAAKAAAITIPSTVTTVKGKPTLSVPTSPEGITTALIGGAGGLNEQVGSMAQKLGGGKTLADVVTAITGNKGRQNLNIAHNTTYGTESKKFSDNKVHTVLNAQARNDIAKKNKLQIDDTFMYDGIKYGVSSNGNVVVLDFNPAAASNSGHASGGLIKGIGTGTSDSILAKLTGFSRGGAPSIRVSNGEYVIQASTVKQLGVPMLNALNSGRFHIPSNSNSFMTQKSHAGAIEIINNIYPSPDMNMDQLVHKVTAATVSALGQTSKVNAKMVGVNRSI